MNEGKKKPIEERIAALLGRSAYRDVRDGIGGTTYAALSDQDLAAAVGMVNSRLGKIAGWVLETHYGSTLMHRDSLLRAWEDNERKPNQPREETVLIRFAGELAIRELASVRYGTPQLGHYAYLISSRRERLQGRLQEAGQWLDGIHSEALRELRECVREVRSKKNKQAA